MQLAHAVITLISLYIFLVNTSTSVDPYIAHVLCQPVLILSTSDKKYRFGCPPTYILTIPHCMYMCVSVCGIHLYPSCTFMIVQQCDQFQVKKMDFIAVWYTHVVYVVLYVCVVFCRLVEEGMGSPHQ